MSRIKINKFLFLLTFALLPSVVVCGKKAEKPDTITARRAFIEMPSGVLDLLPKDTRLDMLDYYSNDSIWKAINNLRGISYLEKATMRDYEASGKKRREKSERKAAAKKAAKAEGAPKKGKKKKGYIGTPASEVSGKPEYNGNYDIFMKK